VRGFADQTQVESSRTSAITTGSLAESKSVKADEGSSSWSPIPNTKMRADFHALSDASLLRHFLLQYFTSPHVLVHALRQVVSVPHTTHGLTGRMLLLLLKRDFIGSA